MRWPDGEQNDRWKRNEEAKKEGRDKGQREMAVELAELQAKIDARNGGREKGVSEPAASAGAATDGTGEREPKPADLAAKGSLGKNNLSGHSNPLSSREL